MNGLHDDINCNSQPEGLYPSGDVMQQEIAGVPWSSLPEFFRIQLLKFISALAHENGRLELWLTFWPELKPEAAVQEVGSLNAVLNPVQNTLSLNRWMIGCIGGKAHDGSDPEYSGTPCLQMSGAPELTMFIGFDPDGWQAKVLGEP